MRQQLAAQAPDHEAFLSGEAALRAAGCALTHICLIPTTSLHEHNPWIEKLKLTMLRLLLVLCFACGRHTGLHLPRSCVNDGAS